MTAPKLFADARGRCLHCLFEMPRPMTPEHLLHDEEHPSSYPSYINALSAAGGQLMNIVVQIDCMISSIV